MASDKINMGLDEIIKMSKKRSSFETDGDERKRARRSAPYPQRNSSFNKSGPAFKRRQTNERPNFRRSGPITRSPEPDVWRHDMFEGEPRNKQTKVARPNQASNATVLKITNLHFSVSEDDIKELFEEFGMVLRSTLHYDRSGRSLGTAEIEFGSREDALKALKQYNKVPLDGQPMEIVLVDNGTSTSSDMSSRLGVRPAKNFDRPQQNFDRPQQNFGRTQQNFNRPVRRNNNPREQTSRAPTRDRKQEMTKEQLDAELDDYLNKGVESDDVMA